MLHQPCHLRSPSRRAVRLSLNLLLPRCPAISEPLSGCAVWPSLSLLLHCPAISEPPSAQSGCERGPAAAIMSNPADKDNVRVVVRVRPLNDTELVAGHQSAVEVNPLSGSVSLRSPAAAASEPPKTFTFDLAFGPDSKQVSERTHQTRG